MNEDRTWLISVLFLDIFKFSCLTVEQQLVVKRHFQDLVSGQTSSLNPDDLIQLDTGDGIALCYLGDPEKLFPLASNLRKAFEDSNGEQNLDYKVRLGLNLGPVKIVQDMNNKRNCIGSGITDAERIMSFAKENQLLVSKSYFEMVSKMSDIYSRHLEYLGCMSDKHDQPHDIYILTTQNSNTSEASESSFFNNIDDEIISRIQREYCMYINRNDAEKIINSARLKASNLKEFCEILTQQIQSRDDQFSFNQYLRSYGYSGY